ncbi:probable 2-oxoglutarate-dependent dioxygenase AOP1 isoform X2 [Elaeis guineensis]|uniref:probable 2-oxoglutarate-dependent dioxygenase AOP1 isoform X2 n=1 Tax=Elaeis guineensis var. tenera TaxID=51953 RepID=UPI003C6DB355
MFNNAGRLASNYINCTRRQVPGLEEGRSLPLEQIKKTLMGSGEKTQLLQIPKVDFRGLDPCNPGGDGWESVRVQAMRALESFGCLEAIYDGVSPELKEALFGRAMGELFALPLETKTQSASDKPYQGYIGQIPTMAYESLRVDGAPDLEKVEEFARLMWPQGNPNFCQTVWNFAKQVQKLEQMVERMVLQSLGVDKYWTSHTESLAHGVRLGEHGIPLDQETKIAMVSHVDPNMMTIICQHQVKGLEVQTKDGEWIDVEPLPNSFTVVIGEVFEVMNFFCYIFFFLMHPPVIYKLAFNMILEHHFLNKIKKHLECLIFLLYLLLLGMD